MPITYVTGDLLKSDCDVIAHGCNCFCTMGSGIARAIRATHPEAYEADLATAKGDRNKLGSCSAAQVDYCGQPRFILNLYTQYNFGTHQVQVDYAALENCMRILRDFGKPRVLKKGIPLIGCGLAGGDWKIVSAIIEKVFGDEDIHVYKLE